MIQCSRNKGSPQLPLPPSISHHLPLPMLLQWCSLLLHVSSSQHGRSTDPEVSGIQGWPRSESESRNSVWSPRQVARTVTWTINCRVLFSVSVCKDAMKRKLKHRMPPRELWRGTENFVFKWFLWNQNCFKSRSLAQEWSCLVPPHAVLEWVSGLSPGSVPESGFLLTLILKVSRW